MSRFPRVNILGVGITAIDLQRAVGEIERIVRAEMGRLMDAGIFRMPAGEWMRADQPARRRRG